MPQNDYAEQAYLNKEMFGISGKIKESRVGENGERVIENFSLQSASLVSTHDLNLTFKRPEVKFYLCDPLAKVPAKGSENAAGFDLVAVESHIGINSDENLLMIGTGVQVEIPTGYFGMLVPRSSIYKKDLILANSVGIIDSDYRGEIMFVFKSLKSPINSEIASSLMGERIGQLLILPLPNCTMVQVNSFDELSSTQRGEGGFGSTGSK